MYRHHPLKGILSYPLNQDHVDRPANPPLVQVLHPVTRGTDNQRIVGVKVELGVFTGDDVIDLINLGVVKLDVGIMLLDLTLPPIAVIRDRLPKLARPDEKTPGRGLLDDFLNWFLFLLFQLLQILPFCHNASAIRPILSWPKIQQTHPRSHIINDRSKFRLGN